MKVFFTVLSLILFLSASAQKMTREVIGAEGIEKIVLQSDEVYKIRISTSREKEIVITTRTEGEYFNDIGLDSELREKSLFLASRYKEILQNGYDKLSAHKVFSMEVEMKIPAEMIVEVNSNLASVYLNGVYERALVQLKNGSCYLEDFSGNAVINTYDGNILGTALDFTATASFRHGEVRVAKMSNAKHKLVLTSINGDIKISETK